MEQNHQNLQSQFFIEHILQILPHRYPMLLVDRITELQANKKLPLIRISLLMKMCLTGISLISPFSRAF